MKATFTPAICKPLTKGVLSVPAAYTGTVTMRMPDYDERMEISELFEAAEGYVVAEGDGQKRAKNGRMLRFCARRAPDFIEAIDITRVEDGYQFTSFDDLKFDTDMAGVITEIATRLVGKFLIGMYSSPSLDKPPTQSTAE